MRRCGLQAPHRGPPDSDLFCRQGLESFAELLQTVIELLFRNARDRDVDGRGLVANGHGLSLRRVAGGLRGEQVFT